MLWCPCYVLTRRNTQLWSIIQKKQDYYNAYYYYSVMTAVSWFRRHDGGFVAEVCKYKEILKTAKNIDITLILNYDEICIYFRK